MSSGELGEKRTKNTQDEQILEKLKIEDILGIIDTAKERKVMILDPQEETQPENRRLYAVTAVSITLKTKKDLIACIEALRNSDEALRMRPDSLKLWDWQRSYLEGMTVSFGVNWYDKQFFEEHKEAYLNTKHIEEFKKFGATPQDFQINHKVLS